eukprot:scaffold19058_cov30-Tisochrysis_lutea.AAC.1
MPSTRAHCMRSRGVDRTRCLIQTQSRSISLSARHVMLSRPASRRLMFAKMTPSSSLVSLRKSVSYMGAGAQCVCGQRESLGRRARGRAAI